MAEAGHAAAEVDNTRENKYKQIMGIRTVHLLSFFALIYVGVEVTLGGETVITPFKLAIPIAIALQAGLSPSSSRSEKVAHRQVIFHPVSSGVGHTISLHKNSLLLLR